jgi:hypothetical protein
MEPHGSIRGVDPREPPRSRVGEPKLCARAASEVRGDRVQAKQPLGETALSGVSIDGALEIPARNTWDQGDILTGAYFSAFDDYAPAVLMTPACDLAHEKVALWTVVALFPDEEVAEVVTAPMVASWGGGQITKNQRGSIEKDIRSLILQKFPRYHWIPIAIGSSAAHVADFTCVTSLPAAEVRDNAERIASLRSSWREQLPARYAAYLGRVGTEDFVEKAVQEHVERLVESVVQRR